VANAVKGFQITSNESNILVGWGSAASIQQYTQEAASAKLF